PLLVGNVLQIVESGNTYGLQFDPTQDFTGQQFEFSPDGGGGTQISLAQISTVAPGETVSDVVVSSGVVEHVSGTTINAIVDSGGSLVVEAGGVTSGTVVSGGGSQVVQTSGTASGTTVQGGAFEFTASGGTAFDLTVSAGGVETDHGA